MPIVFISVKPTLNSTGQHQRCRSLVVLLKTLRLHHNHLVILHYKKHLISFISFCESHKANKEPARLDNLPLFKESRVPTGMLSSVTLQYSSPSPLHLGSEMITSALEIWCSWCLYSSHLQLGTQGSKCRTLQGPQMKLQNPVSHRTTRLRDQYPTYAKMSFQGIAKML